MTAQFGENLLYQGRDVPMYTNPLSDYFEMTGIRPQFKENCTALWRGYIGTWEIVDNRMYLIDINGTLEDDTDVSLATIFPEFPSRVFAHWYSGTIRIPRGDRIEYVHMGYGSTYEMDLLLDVEKGVVVDTRVRSNRTERSETSSKNHKSDGI